MTASVTTAYSDERVTLLHGDCIAAMRELPDNSVDSIVTDPPYGLGFMGKAWDDLPPGLPWAQECLRVLKPGGHLLAFGGSRTWHRLAVAVEDAGFEIRDSIAWLYGSGFPKSLDVSKAIDKANGRNFEDRYALGRHIREQRIAKGLGCAEVNGWFGYKGGCEHWERQDASGARVPTIADFAVLRERLDLSDEHAALVERVEAEREVIGQHAQPAGNKPGGASLNMSVVGMPLTADITAPATPDAERWAGWGTALKPAFEPVVVGRKPLDGKTVAANVLAWGTGALNIDASRITANDQAAYEAKCASVVGLDSNRNGAAYGDWTGERADSSSPSGRWPANVILDESQGAALDQQSGILHTQDPATRYRASDPSWSPSGTARGQHKERNQTSGGLSEKGTGASRFFYCAKAPKSERPIVDGVAHPTVKPLSLMRYLVKLVTPPGGTTLEPFAGSGATVEAALLEGFNVIAVEREADYLPLIQARVERFNVSVTEAEFAAWLSSVQESLI